MNRPRCLSKYNTNTNLNPDLNPDLNNPNLNPSLNPNLNPNPNLNRNGYRNCYKARNESATLPIEITPQPDPTLTVILTVTPPCLDPGVNGRVGCGLNAG